MRSMSLKATMNTMGDGFPSYNSQIHESSKTIQANQTIKQKIKTFTQWNFRSALQAKKKKSMHLDITQNQTENENVIENALFTFLLGQQQKQGKKKKDKNNLVIEQLQGIKTQRKQRFKKIKNPTFIVKHYIQKQGYQPCEEEQILLDQIVQLKQLIETAQPFNLEYVLEKIFVPLNIAIDLNQTKVFILIIVMIAQICFQAKQMKASFYFYTQAMTAATCARFWSVKLQSLIYMGKICMEVLQYPKAVLFFKKALQYSWKIKDQETQLKIYDLIGQSHYYEGRSELALYYHNRYILGQFAFASSAVRRMSYEMLAQYQKTLHNSQKQNLSQLFLEYLRLPILSFSQCPTIIKKNKNYPNYVEGSSPRRFKKSNFSFNQIPPVNAQIQKILNEAEQFKTQIPNPDLRRNFVVIPKYGRKKKDIQFTQSNDFHKIVGIKISKVDKSVLKLPEQQQIHKILSQKPNPHWWQDILTRSKKQRSQKLGSIRNKIQKMHLSYHKYPQQKRRAQSLKHEKISETVNKTILNWIDPPKK